MTSHPSRRTVLKAIAVTATGAMLPRNLMAGSQPLLEGSDVCLVLPEVTEGPYYLDSRLVRRDIREGRAGVPVVLRLQVVDSACAPLPGARVDVWHCDAQGIYSGFGGDTADRTSSKGETFLRGTQIADTQGVAEFLTVYPGWYRGRTTHIHYKIFLDETNVLTGQIFLPDALSEYLYAAVPAYHRDGTRDTMNGTDGIAAEASRAAFANVKEDAEAYLVTLIVGVDPEAEFTGTRQPGPPPAGEPRPRTAVGASPYIPGDDG
ncbi:MAG: intradiol ring-cleavage dioxygenase [Rhodobacteraceae bacterium]|nr:intradiol ring-cleavage dioxygenase [Paracoccaceae bacterium]